MKDIVLVIKDTYFEKVKEVKLNNQTLDSSLLRDWEFSLKFDSLQFAGIHLLMYEIEPQLIIQLFKKTIILQVEKLCKGCQVVLHDFVYMLDKIELIISNAQKSGLNFLVEFDENLQKRLIKSVNTQTGEMLEVSQEAFKNQFGYQQAQSEHQVITSKSMQSMQQDDRLIIMNLKPNKESTSQNQNYQKQKVGQASIFQYSIGEITDVDKIYQEDSYLMEPEICILKYQDITITYLSQDEESSYSNDKNLDLKLKLVNNIKENQTLAENVEYVQHFCLKSAVVVIYNYLQESQIYMKIITIEDNEAQISQEIQLDIDIDLDENTFSVGEVNELLYSIGITIDSEIYQVFAGSKEYLQGLEDNESGFQDEYYNKEENEKGSKDASMILAFSVLFFIALI